MAKKVNVRKAERKILSFSTTMRNPYRIGNFLVVLLEFKNQILTHEIIMKIVKGVLRKKIYKPDFIKNNKEYNDKFYDSEYVFSDEELDFIIDNSPQKHKEKSFDNGWESRFDTWYKLISEFGFCYYAKGQKILISEIGELLIGAFFDKENNTFKEECDYALIESIFLNTLSKYEVGNPYKKNLNHNAPFRLLIRLLLHLKNQNQSPLSVKEIPILLCWKNDNASELYDYICNLREENYKLTKVNFGYSSEFIYEKCLELLESDNTTRFKISQLSEATDEYIRKMRITGLISLRGNGRFIDINNNEIKKVEYVNSINTYFLGDYLDDSDSNRLEFYNYISKIDTFLITPSIVTIDDEVKIEKLKEVSKIYNIETIKYELLITCSKNRPTKDEFLKLIDKPLRFEFLTAVYLMQSFNNLSVIPNYKSDDDGNPIFTASGGKADIIAYDNNTESYIEVSLATSRTQSTNEMIPISRHLEEYITTRDNKKEKFSIFIAPSIHSDAIDYAKFKKFKNNINIPYYAIDDFIKKVETSNELTQLNDESLLI